MKQIYGKKVLSIISSIFLLAVFVIFLSDITYSNEIPVNFTKPNESSCVDGSYLNASMTSVCGSVGQESIQNYFGDVWIESVTKARDWASVIFLLKDNVQVASSVRDKAAAIYEIATQAESKCSIGSPG